MNKKLQEAFRFYLENQAKLVREYNGKVIAIMDEKVLGAFDTEADAVREISKTHPLGSFLVQKVGPGEDSYTQTFHSRVSFA
jgi:hypothetical protein